jgi:arylsulfatase A-like enzyme
MNRKSKMLLPLIAIIAFGPGPVFGQSNANSLRPNLVVFLVDDMGIMDTSLPFLTDENGNPKRYPLNDHYRAPNMERLAAKGIRFNQFYAMSVCSPTRISIMTGQNAARHGTTNWINERTPNSGPHGPPDYNWKGLAKSDVTLPRLLRGAGYRTIHVGKGHFGPRGHDGEEPLNLGFDVNIGGASFGAPGSYYAEDKYGAINSRRTDHAVPHLEAYHDTGTFLTEALTIEAKKAVAHAVEEKKPFYLYFANYAVHAPFNSDPRFAAHYVDSGKEKDAQAFATLIEGMDKSLGDMLDQLEKLGVADNTLILFMGDNGSDAPLGHEHAVACAAPLRGKKGSHYEGGMRVPFIAAWAKVNPSNPAQKKLPIKVGALQTQVASVCDVFPTLLDLANITAPRNHPVDGHGLARLLTGRADNSREEVFLMHYPHSPHRSEYFTVFRNDDWKVIYHYFPTDVSNGSHYQLYNLKNDPFESTNLAEKNPKELTRMMRGLIRGLEDEGARYPINVDGKPVKPQLP